MKKFFLFFAISPLCATIIVQKNGDVITGKIIKDTPEKFVFQSPYGVLQISKNNVKKLILDEKTIELKNIAVGDKTVKARLVNEENNTATYVTEDGRTIKKEGDESTKPPADAASTPPPAAPGRDKFLIAFQGSFGFANYLQPQDSTPQGFSQPMRAGAWGFETQGYYAFSRFVGLGAIASVRISTGTSSTTDQPPPPQQILSYTTTTTNTYLMFGGGGVLSVLGNLGALKSAHDLRLEAALGYSLNWATMNLSFGNNRPPNFPATATAQGKTAVPAFQGGLVYAYSISESFRLRLGAYYTRIFYTSIYGSVLEAGSGSIGQFKTDFEKSLQAGSQNPALVSFALGLEFSF